MYVNRDLLANLVQSGYITERVHPEQELFIYNYTAKTQYEHYWTPETLMCRGLITNADGKVVAKPFEKFFNVQEHQGTIPLEPFTVTAKMDGSLGILYFADGRPAIATRGSFTSEQAARANSILQRYQEFAFHPEYTYLFEIVYPENRIVVDYGAMEELILLAVIHTETGNELDIHTRSWPFPVVQHYDGIDDIAQLQELQEDNAEGFVIRFESGLRLKMKFEEYKRLHRLLTGINIKTVWEMLRDNQSFDDLLTRVPDEFYLWLDTACNDLSAKFKAIEEQAQSIYTQVKGLPTRKEQAAIITKTAYPAPVFSMLDGKDYRETIWKMVKPSIDRTFRKDEEA